MISSSLFHQSILLSQILNPVFYPFHSPHLLFPIPQAPSPLSNSKPPFDSPMPSPLPSLVSSFFFSFLNREIVPSVRLFIAVSSYPLCRQSWSPHHQQAPRRTLLVLCLLTTNKHHNERNNYFASSPPTNITMNAASVSPSILVANRLVFQIMQSSRRPL